MKFLEDWAAYWRGADMKIGGKGEYSYVQDWNKFVCDYYRVLTGVDENVGRILDLLDELGIAENTLVIYTSDNGYFLGEHGFFDKRLMYEPSLRLPLVMRYPRAIKPGIEIIGVQASRFPAMLNAIKGTHLPQGNSSIAEGIAVGTPGVLPQAIIREAITMSQPSSSRAKSRGMSAGSSLPSGLKKTRASALVCAAAT